MKFVLFVFLSEDEKMRESLRWIPAWAAGDGDGVRFGLGEHLIILRIPVRICFFLITTVQLQIPITRPYHCEHY